MTITMTPTDMITEMDGVPVRLWEGTTDKGVAVRVFVHRMAVRDDQDCTAFEAELREMRAPDGADRTRRVPLSMIL